MPPIEINVQPAPSASPTLWIATVAAAVLAALLTALFARRREHAQWLWERRVELYADVLERARYLLEDASQQEADPAVERKRTLPSGGKDEQSLTAALGLFGSLRVREKWSRVVDVWEEHSRAGTTNLRGNEKDMAVLERSVALFEQLDGAYGDLVKAAQTPPSVPRPSSISSDGGVARRCRFSGARSRSPLARSRRGSRPRSCSPIPTGWSPRSCATVVMSLSARPPGTRR